MRIKKVCIVGMGYVGSTLAVVMAEKNIDVCGVEINPKVMSELKAGRPYFHEIGLSTLLKKYLNKNLLIVNKIPDEKFDAFIICVGSPLDKKRKIPIIEYVISATKDVAKRLSEESLVILRSTVPVGTTRNIVKPILDKSNKKF